MSPAFPKAFPAGPQVRQRVCLDGFVQLLWLSLTQVSSTQGLLTESRSWGSELCRTNPPEDSPLQAAQRPPASTAVCGCHQRARQPRVLGPRAGWASGFWTFTSHLSPALAPGRVVRGKGGHRLVHTQIPLHPNRHSHHSPYPDAVRGCGGVGSTVRGVDPHGTPVPSRLHPDLQGVPALIPPCPLPSLETFGATLKTRRAVATCPRLSDEVCRPPGGWGGTPKTPHWRLSASCVFAALALGSASTRWLW